MHRTVGISPGEGTPSPSTKTIPALLQGPRAGAGAFVVMAREGRNREAGPYTALLSPPPRPRFALLPRPRYPRKGESGVPALILPSPRVIPCTGPWGYRPGRGRGGNPLPVEKNHTGPSPGPPRRSGGYRDKSLGRAQPGGRPIHCPPLSPAPRRRQCR